MTEFNLTSNNKLILTDQNWRIIVNVNFYVNQNVNYKTDLNLYERSDFWNIADGYGDCEDYALTKRRELRQAGCPMLCMRIATCWVEGPNGPGTGEYHAVLIIDTDRGSYVLDNRNSYVRHFDDLPYRWHAIEIPGQYDWEIITTR